MYRIVVVEDEKIIRKGIVYGFDYAKMNCIVVGEARDGEEGIQKIKELHPDIVITDINMPIKDAFEMLEETMNQTFSTIILSGYDEFSNARKAIQYGVSEFIVKPINEIELEEALDRAIHQLKEKETIRASESKKQELSSLSLLPERREEEETALSDMFSFVEKNYGQRFIFQDVADYVGYSPALLHKKFKEHIGITFNEYLNRYRIQTAIQLMKQGDLLLYEIAEKCGFNQYKYFNTVFKKYTGMTASDFSEHLLI